MAPVRLLAFVLAMTALPGCESFPKWSLLEKIPTPGEMLHNMQPHRIAHLNRGSAPGRGDSFYSVSDPIPPVVQDESVESAVPSGQHGEGARRPAASPRSGGVPE